MPGRDGTGPFGSWSNCNGKPAAGFGAARFGRRSSGIYRKSIPVNTGTTRHVDEYSRPQNTENKVSLEKKAAFLEKELSEVKAQILNFAAKEEK